MKKAQSLIEYILILVLISAVAVSLLNFLGKRMSLSSGDINLDTKKDRIESMEYYCKQKNMIYNQVTESCVQSEEKSLNK